MHCFAKVGMRGCNVSTATKKCNSLNDSNKNEGLHSIMTVALELVPSSMKKPG